MTPLQRMDHKFVPKIPLSIMDHLIDHPSIPENPIAPSDMRLTIIFYVHLISKKTRNQ